jgi:hypothetical protein
MKIKQRVASAKPHQEAPIREKYLQVTAKTTGGGKSTGEKRSMIMT